MLERNHIQGLLACILLGVLALGIGMGIPKLGSATTALLLGLFVGPWLRASTRTAPGVTWASKKVLAVTIVVLGFTLDVSALTALGVSSLAFVAFLVVATLATATLLGRVVGLPRGVAMLVGMGNAVCGTSAIAASAPILQDEPGDAGMAIGVVHALGLAGLFGLPALVTLLGMSPDDAGLVVGGSLQAVGHVVAAGFTLGEEVADVALAVKMSRVALLVPLVLVLASLMRREGSASLPWEVAGFAAAAVVALLGVLPASILWAADQAADVLLAIAMAGIGATIDLGRLRKAAPLALAVGALTTVLQVAALMTWAMLW